MNWIFHRHVLRTYYVICNKSTPRWLLNAPSDDFHLGNSFDGVIRFFPPFGRRLVPRVERGLVPCFVVRRHVFPLSTYDLWRSSIRRTLTRFHETRDFEKWRRLCINVSRWVASCSVIREPLSGPRDRTTLGQTSAPIIVLTVQLYTYVWKCPCVPAQPPLCTRCSRIIQLIPPYCSWD